MANATLSGWFEGIMFTLGFISILAIVVAGFNSLYSKNYEIGLGANTSESEIINYQDSAGQKILGGEASFDSVSGLTLKSSWGIIKNAFSIVGNFLTGGFIEEAFGKINLGQSGAVWAKFLRIIFVLSLIFAILYILFKVRG